MQTSRVCTNENYMLFWESFIEQMKDKLLIRAAISKLTHTIAFSCAGLRYLTYDLQ